MRLPFLIARVLQVYYVPSVVDLPQIGLEHLRLHRFHTLPDQKLHTAYVTRAHPGRRGTQHRRKFFKVEPIGLEATTLLAMQSGLHGFLSQIIVLLR